MSAGAIDRCYWLPTAASPGFAPLRGERHVDVAIIGGGIVGIITARLLKDSGHTVAVVEAGRSGHGVTGRSTAKVTAQHALSLQRIERAHGADAARIYAEANRAGVTLIAQLAARHHLACDLESADSFVYATSSKGVEALERELEAGEKAGLSMDLVTEPGLPFPVKAALRLGGQFQFQPVEFVARLAATLPGDGSFIHEHSPAIAWSETGVRTAEGSLTARHVVMATHLPLSEVGQLYALTRPHMHVVMAVPVAPAIAPPGMYISADEPKRSLRRHRAANGDILLILTGPTFKHGDANAEEDGFRQVEEFAREHFCYAGGGYRWTNEDYASSDGLPYVGWAGDRGRSLLVATGFDAWGLSNGAAAAKSLAQLCDGRDDEWGACFAAARHSQPQRGKRGAEVAGAAPDPVSGELRAGEELERAAEGSITKVGDRPAGLYRDAKGRLRAVSAECTHMGCAVGWNPVDRTWDCACHGSRFAADGRVLHGPAIEPLGAVDLSGETQAAK